MVWNHAILFKNFITYLIKTIGNQVIKATAFFHIAFGFIHQRHRILIKRVKGWRVHGKLLQREQKITQLLRQGIWMYVVGKILQGLHNKIAFDQLRLAFLNIQFLNTFFIYDNKALITVFEISASNCQLYDIFQFSDISFEIA